MNLGGKRVPHSLTAGEPKRHDVDPAPLAEQFSADFTDTGRTTNDHSGSAFGALDEFDAGEATVHPASGSPFDGPPAAGLSNGLEGTGGAAPGPEPLTRRFEQVLADYSPDSASLRARVLTGTTAAQRDLATGNRAADTGRRRSRNRPHSTRPAGSPVGARPAGAHRAVTARPRLVTAGALAAVASVIGVSAGIASVVQSESKTPVLVTPVSQSTDTHPVAPPPTAATQPPGAPSATASADQSPPVASPPTASRPPSVAGTDQRRTTGSGRGGQVPPGQADRPRAVRGWGVAPFHSGSELVLPGRTTVDWVVFGDGHGGVAARAAIPFQLIDVSRIAGIGSAERGYPTSVSWTWGTPRAQANHSTTRLRIPGNRSATMTAYRGSNSGKLSLYLGGTSSLRVNVSASGLQSSSFTVTLPGSTAVVTLDLSDLPYWTPATISVSGGGSSFSLAAVVLN